MGEHYENKHRSLIPMDGYRYFYYLLTGKEQGSCIICKKSTVFNRGTMKYARFCDDPSCKEVYRDQFKNRMLGKYGKVHILDSAEMQKTMLANRRISGKYEWSDKSVSLPYTGTYELDFLIFLDTKLKWKSNDILAPSPHIYEYKYQKKTHFYIPDFFIPSLSLEVEIKSTQTGIANADSRNKDILKEKVMQSNKVSFSYIKILDKNYQPFLELIQQS